MSAVERSVNFLARLSFFRLSARIVLFGSVFYLGLPEPFLPRSTTVMVLPDQSVLHIDRIIGR